MMTEKDKLREKRAGSRAKSGGEAKVRVTGKTPCSVCTEIEGYEGKKKVDLLGFTCHSRMCLYTKVSLILMSP